MFTIPALFSIVLKNANKTVQSDRKKVSVGLAVTLHEDSLAYLSDYQTSTNYSQGKNKGRTLYGIVQDEIDVAFFSYYFQN